MKPQSKIEPQSFKPSEAFLILEKNGLLAPNQTPLLFHKETQGPIYTDSRKVTPNGIFIACRGDLSKNKSFDYIQEAIQKGAQLIIGSPAQVSSNNEQKNQVPTISVNSPRKAWSYLAAASFGNPEKKLRLVGITGTNGKTTTALMTYNLLSQHGFPSFWVGTIGNSLEKISTGHHQHTTPDPDTLFYLLAKAHKLGMKFGVLEVSSHGLEQEKLGPIQFATGVFTSFSRDHLDFHPSLKDYFQAKLKLFQFHVQKNGFSIIQSQIFSQNKESLKFLSSKATVYGLLSKQNQQTKPHTKTAHVQFIHQKEALSKISINFQDTTTQGVIPYMGAHNLENFLASWLTVFFLTGQTKWEGEKLGAIPGRMELIPSSTNRYPPVFIDYAHSPEALDEALKTTSQGYPNRRIWLVFGCGGDRDPGKRALMGQVADNRAYFIIITDDNPRTEDSQQIFKDIVGGIKRKTKIMIEKNRKKAILYAMAKAHYNDIILIAGKGHEDYQLIGNKKMPFSDQAVVLEQLNTNETSP